MAHSAFARWGGIAGLGGGLLYVTKSLVVMAVVAGGAATTGDEVRARLPGLALFLTYAYVIAAVLFALALIGLQARFGARFARLGRLAMALAGVAAIASAISIAVTTLALPGEPDFPGALSFVVQDISFLAASVLVGILVWKGGTLQRWSPLPLVLGIAKPLIENLGPQSFPSSDYALLPIGIGWLVLGGLMLIGSNRPHHTARPHVSPAVVGDV